jgi:hypothetical protein
MKSTRSFLAIVVGTSWTTIGCGSIPEEPAGLHESPQLEAQGGPSGTTGTNGASPIAFHANQSALLASFSVAARNPLNPSAVNPVIVATGILGTAGGRQVFSYAARCVLPAGTELTSGGNVYSGGGILNSAASWLTGGLTTSQQEEALTCMVAHLNPSGMHVPVFFSGPSISGTESSESNGFGLEEAVWQAVLPGPGQAPIYYAWPRVDLFELCALPTELSWLTRVCGLPANTCGVEIRYDRDVACTGSNGSFTCNGKPAIQTTLQEGDLCDLFGL